MKMMKTAAILCLVTCFPLSLTATAELRQNPVKDQPWDFLMLAQFWPGTSCVYFRAAGCKVPPTLDGWSIHGLWPSRDAKQQPQFCNNTMKFNYTKIEVLHTELDKYWPYYNSSGDRTYLWAHEWEKHGTCAYTLPSIRGELNFFNRTIELYSKLNIFETLNSAGIVPGNDKQYNLSDVFSVLNKKYKIPQVECYYAEGKHYLDQIWLCYNKNLEPMDCPEPQTFNYRHVMHEAIRVQKSSRFLQFESEKQEEYDSLPASKQGQYFVDCPRDGIVYYISIPRDQTDVETKIDFMEF